MQSINETTSNTSLIPPRNQEAVIRFDAFSYLLGPQSNSLQPLPKNIYLLLDNSFSMRQELQNVVTFITKYFNFLNFQTSTSCCPYQAQGALFGEKTTPVPFNNDCFLANLLKIFKADEGCTLLAPALETVINNWLSHINPSDPHDNFIILITDGANHDDSQVKQIRENFISLLKAKNVALFVFGVNSKSTALSTLKNFTNLKDNEDSFTTLDSSLKINYYFIEHEKEINQALSILANYRTMLQQATVSLYAPLDTELSLVGYPFHSMQLCSEPLGYRRTLFFLGSATNSDLETLFISLRGHWPVSNEITMNIEGIDPGTQSIFSSERITIPLPSYPIVESDTLLTALPKLTKEARISKNRERKREILNVIKLLEDKYGKTEQLLEYEQYLTNAINETCNTEADELLDALKSLKISTNETSYTEADELLNVLNNFKIQTF